MMLFLILAPFGTFAALMLVISPAASLFSAAAVAVATIGYDLYRGRSVKILAAGAALLFTAIGFCLLAGGEGLTDRDIRLAVDLGVLTLALGSILLRLPFTLQYARESVPADTARHPAFMTINYTLSWAWTCAFVAMIIADLLAVYLPSLPVWVGLGVAFAARNSAIFFTRWYPKHRLAQPAPQSH